MSDAAVAIKDCRLEIRRNSDGLTRVSETLWDYYGPFIWVDGNFACDCNRELLFLYAAGEDEDDEHPTECGHGRYAVRVTSSDGKVLYEDFSDTIAPK